MPRTRNSSIDEVDSSASEEGAGMISVFMATGARLMGTNLVGTVMMIGALMLASFENSFFQKLLNKLCKTKLILSFVVAL